jgi:hypothetical protein
MHPFSDIVMAIWLLAIGWGFWQLLKTGRRN